MKKIGFAIICSFCMIASAWADEGTATPEPQVTSIILTVPTPTLVPAALGSQNPSQSEEEKAPVTSKPTAVPKFSLPDVVITGKNELTIGAKRTTTLGSDVSWGAESLTQVNRSTDDLPGLDKSLTALSTQDIGAAQDTAFVLHAGGGVPGTLGGWGLFGKDYTDMQYILYGYYSTWAGETVNGGTDGDQKYRFGGEFKLVPDKDSYLRLSVYSAQVQASLPYQSAVTEVHQGLDTSADIGWKWADHWSSDLLFTSKILTLNYWDQTGLSNQGQEYKGSFKLLGEGIDPFWDSFGLEGGDYQANSNFSAPPDNTYNLAWASLSSGFIIAPEVKISGSLEGQSGDQASLNSKLFPSVQLRWRLADPTLLNLYWKTARSLDSFYDTFMDKEHISPESELPSASEVTGEWGGAWTQKLDESLVLILSGSTAQIQNYHQWTDINPLSVNYIETYSSLPSVQITKAKAEIQWKLDPVWSADLDYQWTNGVDNSGANSNLTFLPEHQGMAALTRADEEWDATLALVAASDRQALTGANLDLPAYATLNLSAAYHFDRAFSLWLKGDNLLGLNYVLEPGYLEPQFHVRGGIEISL